MVINVSQKMKRLAHEIVENGEPEKTAETFQVYRIPVGHEFDNFALLLFKEGEDFSAGQVPEGTLNIPVEVGGRKGYFLDSEIAFSFS
jgi:hypothetical protein